MRPSIRFMGVATRTEARKHRVTSRANSSAAEAAGAPSPVPRVSSQRDTGGRSAPSP